MPRSPRPARGTAKAQPATPLVASNEPAGAGDVYTMTEAARLKGVSYHTVSRAVRRGKLPAQRLGRMALITTEDLREWRPMRERAPRKYRRREPNPDATPALLDLASGERVDLARRLSTLYEVIHGAAAELPLDEFLALLADRLASALDFRRVIIWEIDAAAGRASQLASYGPPFNRLPTQMALATMPVLARALDQRDAHVIEDVPTFEASLGFTPREDVFPATSLFVAPLRVAGKVLGAVIGDCDGERFSLSAAQLGLAQGMANQAALALERAHFRAEDTARVDQLAAILENVSDAVYACDSSGHLTVINAAGRDLLGVDDHVLAQDESMSETVALVNRRGFDGQPIPPSDVPLVRAARGEHIRDHQHLVIRADGTERAVSVNAQPIRRGDGTLAGAVAVARDITSQRAAVERDHQRLALLEAAAARAAAVADVALAVNTGTDLATVLETAIARMTDLLGGMNGAIFFTEASGRMTGQVGYRFGTAAEEMELDPAAVPTTMAAFARRVPLYYTYVDAVPSERAYFDQLGFRAAIIAPLIVGDEQIGVAYVNYATSDRPPSAEELSFAAALASQCAVAIDKTRLMDRIESAHRRLLAVVDQLPQAVVIVEAPQGRLVLANRAAEDLWGSPIPDAGLSALRLADEEGGTFAIGDDPLTKTLTSGEGRYGETLTIIRDDGSRVTVLANHAPILDVGGRIVGAISVLQDVAQLQAIDRAKDEFLSIAAHELRNPLTSLHGNLQLLLRRVQKDAARGDDAHRLEAIIVQSDRLAQLVGRLLDVSRAQLGRLDLEPSPTDAAAVIRRVAESSDGLSSQHTVLTHSPERVDVVWDEMRIEQVLVNLVGNAVKHTPSGNVHITLDEADDNIIRIAIQDQGPGIAHGARSRLFERYYRAGNEPSETGLGLGLYVSRLIARAHGGDLIVEDADGGGARFTLTVPRDIGAQQRGDDQSSTPPSRRERVGTALA
jgi:two-component system phosphate regulon sensor histidine kinase PhoR